MQEELESEPIVGGYDFVFVDELSLGQTCPICLLAMRSPVQTWCGHRFCESCLSRTFRYCIVCTEKAVKTAHLRIQTMRGLSANRVYQAKCDNKTDRSS